MPERLQLKREKGWRLPAGAVKVDRATPWGNPFKVGDDGTVAEVVEKHRRLVTRSMAAMGGLCQVEDQAAYRRFVAEAVETLRGKDLACWCKAGEPCHADVLIELANR